MSFKLEIPVLSYPLDAVSVSSWLSLCEDAFEVYNTMNASKSLSPSLMITAAALKMESTVASSWWCNHRAELKVLTKWEEFATHKVLALAHFYSVRQHSSSFNDFIRKLQEARSALGSAGKGFAISESVMKNHLLFNSNRILMLRVCAIPTLDYGNIKLDSLISLMSSTWTAMVAEGIVHSKSSVPSLPSSSSLATPQFTPLTAEEKATLKEAGGCYRCRKTPSSPGWVEHSSKNCPTRNSEVQQKVSQDPNAVLAVLPSSFVNFLNQKQIWIRTTTRKAQTFILIDG
ncbi:hypothetical protein BJ165DRAFT_1403416 [Panaeolus papilionaceus]|nr:hypothetical protein BJ165DRAFT_1403416 [Panaeolus papilionaceus]